MAELLEVKNLSVSFFTPAGEVQAVRNVSFSLRPGEVLAVLNVTDRAVITSGGYERYFEEDGKTYIHILDPRTGYPADNDLASVTVVSGDGTLADALSTSLYIMGYEGAVEYWRAHREAFDMVLVTEKGEIRVTEGISRDLSVRTEGEASIMAGCR